MFRSALTKAGLSFAIAPKATRAGIAPVLARGYHENVISHYESPRNVRVVFSTVRLRRLTIFPLFQVGSLPKHDADVGTGLVGAPA
jgi:hypothetical protein